MPPYPTASYPEHTSTGNLGYFRNRGSPSERRHRRKREPFADPTHRAWRHDAHNPGGAPPPAQSLAAGIPYPVPPDAAREIAATISRCDPWKR